MKQLKKDPLRNFTKLSDENPPRKGTYRVALQNGVLMASYWDGHAFELENVSHWSERAKKQNI